MTKVATRLIQYKPPVNSVYISCQNTRNCTKLKAQFQFFSRGPPDMHCSTTTTASVFQQKNKCACLQASCTTPSVLNICSFTSFFVKSITESGTNELYHSWATTMNTNVSMAKRSTVLTTLANNCLGKASTLPDGTDNYYAQLIHSTVLLTLVGLCQQVINTCASNNKTINVWLFV